MPYSYAHIRSYEISIPNAMSNAQRPSVLQRSLGKFKLLLILLGLGLTHHFGNDALRLLENDAPSQSIGTTQDGSLVNGKRLPSSGPGFRTYSRFGSLIGRTAVNHRVRDAILEAYATTYQQRPETTYIYGETGWPRGGRFRPHHSHRNGLSVDFMVPVLRNGKPSRLPTAPWLKFGYNVSFDDQGQGQSNGLAIDFGAMVDHLSALNQAAVAQGLAIEVIIFAPDLQDDLVAHGGSSLLSQLRFSRNPSWVRHDDHYHVDFRELAPQ